MWLPDITLQSLGFRVLALVIIVAIHGALVACAVVLLGDKGPKYDGRLTLAPSSHLDLGGAISLIIFGLGWAKPMVIDAQQFRIGRAGVFVVILIGFVGMLITAAFLDALVLPALTNLPLTAGQTVAAFLRAASSLSIWFALLNLIPLPPLTGGLILATFGVHVPRPAQWVPTAVLLVVVATGAARQLLGPAHDALAAIIFGV